MPKRGVDRVESLDGFKEERLIKLLEPLSALSLLFFGFCALAYVWHLLDRMPMTLENVIAFNLLGIYLFAVIETFSIIFLWGLKRIELPKAFVHYIGGATICEIAPILFYIIRKVIQ